MDKPIDKTKQFQKMKCCGGTGKNGKRIGKRYDKDGNRIMRVSSACCQNGENWEYHKWNGDPALGIYGKNGNRFSDERIANLPTPKVNESFIEIDENGEMIKFPKHR